MPNLGSIIAKVGPSPFFLVGAGLMIVGVVLQVTGLVSIPDLGSLGATPFGVFAKIGGALVLFGLGIFAFSPEGSPEPDVHIPDEVPMSARGGPVASAETR